MRARACRCAQHELAKAASLDAAISPFEQVFDEEPFLVPAQHTRHDGVRLHRLQGAFEAHVDTAVRAAELDLAPKAQLDEVAVCIRAQPWQHNRRASCQLAYIRLRDGKRCCGVCAGCGWCSQRQKSVILLSVAANTVSVTSHQKSKKNTRAQLPRWQQPRQQAREWSPTAAVVHVPVEVHVVRPHAEALLAGFHHVTWTSATEPGERYVPQKAEVVGAGQIVAVQEGEHEQHPDQDVHVAPVCQSV